MSLKLALVGAGRMGWVHARALTGLSGCELAWVVDPEAHQAERLAQAVGARRGPLEAVLEDPQVAGVVVATPTATHAALALEVIQAGKALFIEKPLAADLASGAEVVRAAERAGIPVQVGFQRRYDPAYLWAWHWIQEGKLGRILHFRGVARDAPGPSPAYAPTSGGVMVDMGIHDLDVARFLVGEVSEVIGWPALQARKEFGVPDGGVALLRFVGGAVGTLEVSWFSPEGYEIRAEVVGERGRLVLERERQLEVDLYTSAGGSFLRPRDFEERFQEAYRAELEAFVRALALTHAPSPGPREAWKSLRLAWAAQRALEEGRAVRVEEMGEEP
jgi:predicted dehydrogenase